MFLNWKYNLSPRKEDSTTQSCAEEMKSLSTALILRASLISVISEVPVEYRKW